MNFHPTFQVPFTEETLTALLIALYAINMEYLRGNKVPLLLDSGVRYRAESNETWSAIPFILHRGYGDCEDLACWYAAELTLQGRPSFPAPKRQRGTAGKLWHIIVKTPGGFIDPSLALGM